MKTSKNWLLIISLAFWGVFVFIQHLTYGLYPLFYDAPIYVENANEILKIGILSASIKNQRFDLYAIINAGLGLLIGTQLALLILNNLGTLLFIYANYNLARTITNSSLFAGLATFLTIISPSTLYLYKNLPAQTLAFALVLILFAKVETYSDFKVKNLKLWLAILTVIAIYWVHLERTASLMALSFVACYVILHKKSLLKFITVSGILSTVSQAPFLLERFTFYLNPTIKGELTYPIVTPSLDFYLDYLSQFSGGNILIFTLSLVGFYPLFMKWYREKHLPSALFFFWSLGCLVGSFLLGIASSYVDITRWYHFASRLILLYNSPILLTFSITHISKTVRILEDLKEYIREPRLQDISLKIFTVLLLITAFFLLLNVF